MILSTLPSDTSPQPENAAIPPPQLTGSAETPLSSTGTPPRPDGRPPQKSPFSLSMIFLVVLIVTNIPSSRPVLPSRARVVAVYHLVITLLCLAGLIVSWIVEQKKKKTLALQEVENQQSNPWTQAVTHQSLFLAYKSTRKTSFRSELYALQTNRRTQWSILLTPLMFTLLTGISIAGKYTLLEMIGRLSAVLLGVLAFIIGFMCLMFFVRFPNKDSVRHGMLYICQDGIYDYLPDKTLHVPWKSVRSIEAVEGDLYFLVDIPGLIGINVPREGFTDTASADRFIQATRKLWRSTGEVWPDTAVMAEFAPPPNPA